MNFPSVTYKLPTPDGGAVITIVEDPTTNEIVRIFFSIGKAGSTVNAYCDALARMIVLALSSSNDINTILEELSEITSDKQLSTGSGLVYRSGVEVLYLALVNYNRTKDASYNPSRRPAQLTTKYLERR